jgi:hypothetical protein
MPLFGSPRRKPWLDRKRVLTQPLAKLAVGSWGVSLKTGSQPAKFFESIFEQRQIELEQVLSRQRGG